MFVELKESFLFRLANSFWPFPIQRSDLIKSSPLWVFLLHFFARVRTEAVINKVVGCILSNDLLYVGVFYDHNQHYISGGWFSDSGTSVEYKIWPVVLCLMLFHYHAPVAWKPQLFGQVLNNTKKLWTLWCLASAEVFRGLIRDFVIYFICLRISDLKCPFSWTTRARIFFEKLSSFALSFSLAGAWESLEAYVSVRGTF